MIDAKLIQVISNISLERLDLPSLVKLATTEEDGGDDAGLEIESNAMLSYLNVPKLRSIENLGDGNANLYIRKNDVLTLRLNSISYKKCWLLEQEEERHSCGSMAMLC